LSIYIIFGFYIFSDIGGSLRIPAHFSGIFSFKPSYNRLSNQGTTSYKPVHIAVQPVMGPMATCSADLQLFCEATFGHRAIDVMPLKYQKCNDVRNSIVFGYCKIYPFIQVSPACHRAVIETIDKLKNEGQAIVEYEIPKSFDRLVYAFYEIMSADGWQFYFDKLEGEKREKNLQKLLKYAAMPNWIKTIVSWIASLVLKDKRASSIIKGISRKDVYQIHKVQIEIDSIIEEFSRSFEESGVDILIMPVHVLPATPNGSFGDIHFCAAHTFMWNLLNQPIGVMPVTKFDLIKDKIDGIWPRRFKFSDIFKNNFLDCAAQHWYNPDKISELPIGIQIIGKSNEDEKVLQAMSIIEKLMK
jgi:Asp-tRNA(Asn)/Glu-tRNA(Gln) amidotransferase A subunit family amidase